MVPYSINPPSVQYIVVDKSHLIRLVEDSSCDVNRMGLYSSKRTVRPSWPHA